MSDTSTPFIAPGTAEGRRQQCPIGDRSAVEALGARPTDRPSGSGP